MTLEDFLIALDRYNIIREAHAWCEFSFFETLIKIETGKLEAPKINEEKPKKLKKCSTCGKKLPDVTKRIDPYQQDVNNTVTYRNLCDGCYQNCVDDI